jgi:hydroxymethylbilane synthase
MIETIETAGDRRAPDTPWGEGAFVDALQAALRQGRVDLAVHSAKDVPTDEPAELLIAAYLVREDAADVLVGPAGSVIHGLDDLAFGAVVGTDSPRRTAFLRAARPDLEIRAIHGNVDTRLARLDDGAVDALCLAAAGLIRLGRADRVPGWLPAAICPPAVGQGALAVQVRAADAATAEVVGRLDDAATRLAVETERQLLHRTGGGCRAPIGAIARLLGPEDLPPRDRRIWFRAGYATEDGAIAVTQAFEGPAAEAGSGVEVVLGGLAGQAAARAAELGRPPIIVTRPDDQAAPAVLALVDRGFAPIVVPAIAIDERISPDLVAALADPGRFAAIAVTSANGARAIGRAATEAGIDLGAAPQGPPGSPRPRWFAIGESSATALAEAGVVAEVGPWRTSAELGDRLPIGAGDRVLLVRGDLADEELPDRLAARGAVVETSVAYRTTSPPAEARERLVRALAAGPVGAVVTSGSTARGLLGLGAAIDSLDAVLALPIVTLGPTSSAAASRAGFRVVGAAAEPAPGSLADAAAAAFRAALASSSAAGAAGTPTTMESLSE